MAVHFDTNAAVASLAQSYLTPEIGRQRERVLANLPLQAGERVLDAGCGVGLLSESLSARVGPTGFVTGCDQSHAMVWATAARCAALGNVDVLQANVCNLPFESTSFDAVAITQVLLYVAKPLDALIELHRVLRPGGCVAIVETDWRGVVLATDTPELARRIFAAWDAKVPSPHLPCELQPLLRKAGYTLDAVEAVPIVNTDWHTDNFSVPMLRDITRVAAKTGHISQAEADTFSADMRRRGEAGDYLFSVNRFLFAAHR